MKIRKILFNLSLIATSLTACSFSGFATLKAEGTNDIHTEYQLTYINSEDYLDTGFACGTASWSAPNAIKLSWTTKGSKAKEYTVTISEDDTLDSNDVIYTTKDNYLDFYNGKIGQTYYWNVFAEGKTSETSSFTVKNTGPRNLFIEGVENARDIGGWGNIIKQGMLIRSGRLNSDKASTITNEITDKGIYEMVNHLKIRTEIDLRRSSNNEIGSLTNSSVLGDTVTYINIPMAYGGNNILTFKGKLSGDQTEYDNPAAIKQFFELLADENNYPIQYHCSIGKDRTGCLSFLIETLLGADEEYFMRDYMFTNFAKIGGFCKTSEVLDRYYKTVNEYEIGSNLQEKVYNYLSKEVGISTSTLDKVISILEVK